MMISLMSYSSLLFWGVGVGGGLDWWYTGHFWHIKTICMEMGHKMHKIIISNCHWDQKIHKFIKFVFTRLILKVLWITYCVLLLHMFVLKKTKNILNLNSNLVCNRKQIKKKQNKQQNKSLRSFYFSFVIMPNGLRSRKMTCKTKNKTFKAQNRISSWTLYLKAW